MIDVQLQEKTRAGKPRCQKRIWVDRRMRTVQCDFAAKYGDRCGTHAPERQAARAAKRGPTAYERECAARKVKSEALDALLVEVRRVVDHHANAGHRTPLRQALAAYDEVTQR